MAEVINDDGLWVDGQPFCEQIWGVSYREKLEPDQFEFE